MRRDTATSALAAKPGLAAQAGGKFPKLCGTKIGSCRKKHNMLGIDKDFGHLAGDMGRERDEPWRSAFRLKLASHFEQLTINVKVLPGYECEIGTHGPQGRPRAGHEGEPSDDGVIV